jgi:hypothetical protein
MTDTNLQLKDSVKVDVSNKSGSMSEVMDCIDMLVGFC